MIPIHEKQSPEPRVFEHYWECDKHTDHLHTNPLCRGQYVRYYPFTFTLQRSIARMRKMGGIPITQLDEEE